MQNTTAFWAWNKKKCNYTYPCLCLFVLCLFVDRSCVFAFVYVFVSITFDAGLCVTWQIPLPGFQQAFGTTDIGRFSEIFLFSESPKNRRSGESETETSPKLAGVDETIEPTELINTTQKTEEANGSPTMSTTNILNDLHAPDYQYSTSDTDNEPKMSM